jgi:hypothetical protein
MLSDPYIYGEGKSRTQLAINTEVLEKVLVNLRADDELENFMRQSVGAAGKGEKDSVETWNSA